MQNTRVPFMKYYKWYIFLQVLTYLLVIEASSRLVTIHKMFLLNFAYHFHFDKCTLTHVQYDKPSLAMINIVLVATRQGRVSSLATRYPYLRHGDYLPHALVATLYSSSHWSSAHPVFIIGLSTRLRMLYIYDFQSIRLIIMWTLFYDLYI